jgi:hypothetical protein
MPEKQTARCVNCNSSNTRRIIQKGVKTNVMRMFNRVPYHCQACYQVFFAHRPEKLEPDAPEEPKEHRPAV